MGNKSKVSRFTFEKYFEEKENKGKFNSESFTQIDFDRRDNKSSCNSFRNILIRMNSQVKQSKKRRVREKGVEGEEEDLNERILTITTSEGRRNFKKVQ